MSKVPQALEGFYLVILYDGLKLGCLNLFQANDLKFRCAIIKINIAAGTGKHYTSNSAIELILQRQPRSIGRHCSFKALKEKKHNWVK